VNTEISLLGVPHLSRDGSDGCICDKSDVSARGRENKIQFNSTTLETEK